MKRTLPIAFALLALLPHQVGGQAPSVSVEALYADARAKEKAVRTALVDPTASSSVLKAVRTVVADYETLVRQYPASAYSDDALWFAGWLSVDAFETFGDERERAAGTRLWRALAAQYPTSKLAKQVPQQLERVEQARSSPPEAASTTDASGPQPSDARHEPVEPSVIFSPSRDERLRGPQPARPARPPIATLRDIRRIVLPDAVRVTLELDHEVPFHDERLARPARIFVDLPSTHASPDLLDRTIRFDDHAGGVRQIRIGRHTNNTTRVVLDIAGISSYSVYPLYGPYRLVIDCLRATPAQPAARIPAAVLPPVAARLTAPLFASALPLAPLTLAAPDTDVPLLPSNPVAPSAAPVTPPTRNLGGGFSIARQLGLRVSRIVIDPGHGGHDPGATGKGVTEAALVLDVALRLEKLLAKAPGVEVILTRRTDEFVGLQERTAIANREEADLFLSIHANASANSQAHGIETYFLNFATTSTAAAVAARENAASGQPMAALPDFVKAIALHNKLDESRDFATYVQRAMVDRLRGANRNVRDLGVKQAPFVVLIGASMPSVLAEMSFLTNAQEVKLLRSSAYRQRIAEALFDAIRKYQGSLKTDTKVAQ